MLLELAVVLRQIDRSILLRDRDDADLLPLEWICSVRERNGVIRLRVDELLEVTFGNMVAHTEDSTPAASDFLDADKDVRLGVPPAVRKGENVFDKLALFFVGRTGKRILVSLVVKRGAFSFVQQLPIRASFISWSLPIRRTSSPASCYWCC